MDEDLAANAERLGQLLRSQLQAIRSPRIQQARSQLREGTDMVGCDPVCLTLHSMFVTLSGFNSDIFWGRCASVSFGDARI